MFIKDSLFNTYKLLSMRFLASLRNTYKEAYENSSPMSEFDQVTVTTKFSQSNSTMTGAGIEPATSSTEVRWLYHCTTALNRLHTDLWRDDFNFLSNVLENKLYIHAFPPWKSTSTSRSLEHPVVPMVGTPFASRPKNRSQSNYPEMILTPFSVFASPLWYLYYHFIT